MKKSLFILTIIWAFVLHANADTGFVFKGKIGNYPIVMTIWATFGDAWGCYYYESQGKNNKLELHGEPDLDSEEGNVWIFTETLSGVLNSFNGYFRMNWDRANPNVMSGYYINKKGKMYRVNLRCVKTMSNPEHC